ncbi:hypothetical protein [Halosimplex salinum]|uniref:hypothetical protein n=1 Tax=Halosimplex salinum TaxID=1710538 RepID=UPI000F47763F|nr:hypothetical protein [Halosimplex salinum]
MTAPESGHRWGPDTATVGRIVSCPRCGRATGVPVPSGSRIVDEAVATDDAVTDAADAVEAADGSSPTMCPNCDVRFAVAYEVDAPE